MEVTGNSRTTMDLGSLFQWEVGQLTMKGQQKSGDGCLVKVLDGSAVVAVMDGLGHGEEAAAAAKIAADIVEANASADLVSIFKRVHEALRQSRGAVMSVALVNGMDATIAWLGVGNVAGFLVRANPEMKPRKESLLVRPGILGGQLPTLDACTVPLVHGDTLVFATDGIRSGFDEEINLHQLPRESVAKILAKYSKENDDALVLVARYLGS
jgi:negative regulator of sigma-B (phosphoserine phosphatase)